MPPLLSFVGKALGNILKPGSGSDASTRSQGRADDDRSAHRGSSGRGSPPASISSRSIKSSPSCESALGDRNAAQRPSSSDLQAVDPASTGPPSSLSGLGTRPIPCHPLDARLASGASGGGAADAVAANSRAGSGFVDNTASSDASGSSPPAVPTFFRASRASLSDTTASAAGEALRQASMTNRKANFTRDNLVSYMRWVRASRGAIKLARKGTARGPNPTLLLRCEHWLEVTDEEHRYGSNLRVYFDYWVAEMEAAELTPPPSPALMSPSPSHMHLAALASHHHHHLHHHLHHHPHPHPHPTPHPTPHQHPAQQQHHQDSAEQQQQEVQQAGGDAACTGASPVADVGLRPSRFSSDATATRPHSRLSAEYQQPAQEPLQQCPQQQQQEQQIAQGPRHVQVPAQGPNHPQHPTHLHPQHHHYQVRVKHRHLHWNYQLGQHEGGQSGAQRHPQGDGEDDSVGHAQLHPQPHPDILLYEREGSVYHETEDGVGAESGCRTTANVEALAGLEGIALGDGDAEGEGEVQEEGTGTLRAHSFRRSGNGSGRVALPSSHSLQLRRRSCGEVAGPPVRHPAATQLRPSGVVPAGSTASSLAAAAAGPAGAAQDRGLAVPVPCHTRPASSTSFPSCLSSAVAVPPLPLGTLACSSVPSCGSPRRSSLCSPSKRFVLAAMIDMSPMGAPGEEQEQPGGPVGSQQPANEPQQGDSSVQQWQQTPQRPGDCGLSARCVATEAACCQGASRMAPHGNSGDGGVVFPAVGSGGVSGATPATPPLMPQRHQGPDIVAAATAAAGPVTPGVMCSSTTADGEGLHLAGGLTAHRASKLLSSRAGMGNGSSFFRWLDSGPGLQVDLVHLGVSRAKLDVERVKYLTPQELLEYELDVDMETGLLRYKRSGKLLHTGPDGRASVDEHARPPTPPPPAVPLSLLGEGAAAWWRGSAAAAETQPATPTQGSGVDGVAPVPVSPHAVHACGGRSGSGGGGGMPSVHGSRLIVMETVPEAAAMQEVLQPVPGPQPGQHLVHPGLQGLSGDPSADAAAAMPEDPYRCGGGSAALPDLGVRGHSASSLNRVERTREGCCSLPDHGGSSGRSSSSSTGDSGSADSRPSSAADAAAASAAAVMAARVGVLGVCAGGIMGTGGGGGGGVAMATTSSTAGFPGIDGFMPTTTSIAAAAGGAGGRMHQPGHGAAAQGATGAEGAVFGQEGQERREVDTASAALLEGQLMLPGMPRQQHPLSSAAAVGAPDGASLSQPCTPPANLEAAAAAAPMTPLAMPPQMAAAPTAPAAGVGAGHGGQGLQHHQHHEGTHHHQHHQHHHEEKVAKWIYVVDPELRLFVHPKVRGRFHHSSFLCGGAVVAAGGLAARHGRLRLLTADSGHYWPREENFRWLCEHLVSVGADLSACELRSKHMPVPAATGRELMEKMGVPPPPWRLPYHYHVAAGMAVATASPSLAASALPSELQLMQLEGEASLHGMLHGMLLHSPSPSQPDLQTSQGLPSPSVKQEAPGLPSEVGP